MGKKMTKSVYTLILIALIISSFCLEILAQERPYYIQKESWQETMRCSREKLLELEQAGELGAKMPDLGTSDFTIAFWVKTESEGGAIFIKTPGEREGGGFEVKVLYLENGAPVYTVLESGNLDSETKINDGQWHHIALTGNSPHEFYIDGKSVKKEIKSAFKEMSPEGAEYAILVGNNMREEQDEDSERFQGLIDEMRIYNYRLSGRCFGKRLSCKNFQGRTG
jgi:hypothetical protein